MTSSSILTVSRGAANRIDRRFGTRYNPSLTTSKV